MALAENRFCIFCGKQPNSRTREHVVPYWLLEMTGDPTRIVTLGKNYDRNQEPIRYSWSNYVAPSCNDCNNKYSILEGRAKNIVEALQRRRPLPVSAYIDLLDWLDKVRIGVWLTRHLIENHPIEINPHFHISSRIAEKDRMLALYVFESENKGINLLGADSLIFNDMPSCFGFRVNDLLFLNLSFDFFCSRGCGLPYPNSRKFLMGGANHGKLKLEGFSYESEILHPITDLKLFKPVVWLYQPIKLPSNDPDWQGGYYGYANPMDTRIADRTLKYNERQGALFRQFKNHVEVLQEPSQLIELDEVIGDDCAMQKDISASVYELQITLFSELQHEWIEPEIHKDFEEKYRQIKIDDAAALAKFYRDAI